MVVGTGFVLLIRLQPMIQARLSTVNFSMEKQIQVQDITIGGEELSVQRQINCLSHTACSGIIRVITLILIITVAEQ